MFFPWYKSCFHPDSMSPSNWRQHRLEFLKFMRDDLEARLAAINAAIETIERQNSQENN
jgi:hypothetical protein